MCIVWFEEQVPMIEEAAKIMRTAEVFAVIGTSLLVYPAYAPLFKQWQYGIQSCF